MIKILFNKRFFYSVLFLILILLAIYGSIALAVGINAEKDNTEKSDVILVLGAGVYVGGEFNPCLKARVKHAVDLYNLGFAPKILVTGGDDNGNRVNEAEAMRDEMIMMRVPAENILLEKNATSTYENLLYSKEILEQHNLKTALIVTEPFHIRRASLVAKKLDYAFSVSPAVESSCWVQNKYFSKYFLKEPVALIVYKLQNKL